MLINFKDINIKWYLNSQLLVFSEEFYKNLKEIKNKFNAWLKLEVKINIYINGKRIFIKIKITIVPNLEVWNFNDLSQIQPFKEIRKKSEFLQSLLTQFSRIYVSILLTFLSFENIKN